MKKRGQLTIFIIVAILIVAILLVLFWPQIKTLVSPSPTTPNEYLAECVEEDIQKVLKDILYSGGSLNQENYVLYQGESYEYLCYTNMYYEKCLIQKPMLKSEIENELKNNIDNLILGCVENYKERMRSKGYEVSGNTPRINIEIIPSSVEVNVVMNINLVKEDESVSYPGFKIKIPSQSYNLIMIATSVLNWEARYGDSNNLAYMMLYPNLKVIKQDLGDGSTIYKLSNRNTEEELNFATRSVAYPPGFGLGLTHER